MFQLTDGFTLSQKKLRESRCEHAGLYHVRLPGKGFVLRVWNYFRELLHPFSIHLTLAPTITETYSIDIHLSLGSAPLKIFGDRYVVGSVEQPPAVFPDRKRASDSP